MVMDPDPEVMIMIYCESYVTEIWQKALLSSWKPVQLYITKTNFKHVYREPFD